MRVLERTGSVGGRLARADVPPIGRRVEWGAAYLTGYGIEPFIERWSQAGLLEPWTDTFALAGPHGVSGQVRGPMRYRAPGGLRSLARDLAQGLHIEFGSNVQQVAPGMVLALPRPQAAALHPPFGGQPWEAVTVTVAVYADRGWPEFPAAFVNGDDDLALIVDDGIRVGDGAPVLVLYEPGRPTTWPGEAPQTDRAVPAASRILGVPAPLWTVSRTWRLAQPALPEAAPFGYDAVRRVGAVGDGWAGKPRIGAAITSGVALAEYLMVSS